MGARDRHALERSDERKALERAAYNQRYFELETIARAVGSTRAIVPGTFSRAICELLAHEPPINNYWLEQCRRRALERLREGR